MAAIQSLLNPAPEISTISDSELDRPSSAAMSNTDHHPTHHTRSKKQKICKDAAVFARGPIHGECRYPPYEYQDEILAARHEQFEIFPMGEIADFPRHIPYNSEKKGFSGNTGRSSLEVFQYTFKVPGDSVQYAMLWDYNIGLVRTTPLFKCTGHSKTTPAKMLNRNPGLRDICHSITGGALVAQGYWMPYEAAKAVAATFCWNIRHALTPVFGTDFPAMCAQPGSDKFGDMTIDPAITKRCTEQAETYYRLQRLPITRLPPTPDTPLFSRKIKSFRPRLLKVADSEYSSDVGSEDSRVGSPTTPEQPYRGLWTPANTPRSVPHLPSPKSVTPRKRLATTNPSDRRSSPALSPKSHYVREVDEAYDGDSSDDSAMEDAISAVRKVSNVLPSDEKAAYLLMSLRLQGARKDQRRAST